MRQSCGEFGEKDKWEKKSVNHAHSLQDGIGGRMMVVGTAIIQITVISAGG